MAFSAECHVLIKVLRQEKGYSTVLEMRFGGSCRSMCATAGFMTLISRSCIDQRLGTFPQGVHRWSNHAVASKSSSSYSSTFPLRFQAWGRTRRRTWV